MEAEAIYVAMIAGTRCAVSLREFFFWLLMTRMHIQNKPDIVDVVRDAGIEVIQKGNGLWARCPFHNEKTASFKIDKERQFFYCFGCHEHGDVITFTMKLRGIAFKEALGVLGIDSKNPSLSPPKRWIDRRQRLVEEFHAWCRWYRHECLELIGIVDRIERLVDDPAYLLLQGVSDAFLARFIAQYHVWLLTGSFDNEDVVALYKAYR